MKTFFFFFFWRALALCVLGPWPRAFLSLASRVSVLGKAVLGLGLGFFLCPWPWPRALCPRLHLCWLYYAETYNEFAGPISAGLRLQAKQLFLKKRPAPNCRRLKILQFWCRWKQNLLQIQKIIIKTSFCMNFVCWID